MSGEPKNHREHGDSDIGKDQKSVPFVPSDKSEDAAFFEHSHSIEDFYGEANRDAEPAPFPASALPQRNSWNFRNFSIGGKLSCGFGILIIIFIAAVLLSIQRVNKTKVIIDRATSVRVITLNNSTQLLLGVFKSVADLRGFIIKKDQSFKTDRQAAWETYIRPALKELRALSKNFTNDENEHHLDEINSTLEDVALYQQQIEDIVHTPENRPADKLFTEQIIPPLESIIFGMTKTIEIEKTLEPTAERKALLAVMADIRTSMVSSLEDMREFLSAGEEASKATFDQTWAKAVGDLEALGERKTMLNPEQRIIFEQAEKSRNTVTPFIDKAITIRMGEQWNMASYLFETKTAPLSRTIMKNLTDMVENQKELLGEDVNLIAENNKETKQLLYILMVVGVILSVLAGLVITKNITTPLADIVGGVRNIAEDNDLTKNVHVKSHDEVGILGSMFNNMRHSLFNIVARIQQAALKINTSANEILAAANQQESTTNEQSSQMTEIQATLNEIASASQELSRTAHEVANFVKETGQEAENGASLIDETTTKMAVLNDSNKSISERLRILNEKIEGIAKMLETILSVADQTNLLSLNAAIEASKAGEHGKGFSVVAQEIRRLADKTAQSSEEISNLIHEIQAASSSATMVMEKSSQDVTGSTKLVSEFADKFSKINEKVQNIMPQMENISSTITEQASANKQILAAVNQMTEALKLTASASKQTKQSVYDLTSMGQQLRTAVSRFKLN